MECPIELDTTVLTVDETSKGECEAGKAESSV